LTQPPHIRNYNFNSLVVCCLLILIPLQLILVASAAARSMGIGPFFSLLAGLNLLAAAAAGLQIYKHARSSKEACSSSSMAVV
jgi:hypothetical protein